MTKKAATIFDFINGITHQKKSWESWSDQDKKSFSPYMINRWLSMRIELVEFINELQKYTIGQLDSKLVYKLYHSLLPNSKSFAKYVKGKSDTKYTNELVQIISKHFLISNSEAIEYIGLLGKDKCNAIVSMYGHSKKELTKILKGV